MSIPFRAITAFHAAARTGSMQQAAEVLGVTPSAVSQQIQIIEAHIGVRLFSRKGRKSVLTEAGERYYEMIRDDVDRITAATERMRGVNSYTTLNVRIAPTFATKWVMPRLDEFLALHPDIELRLDATNEPPDFARENIDLEIRHGAGPWHGLHVEPLVDEPMEVLCAPKYAAAQSLSAAELDGHPLIHSVKNVVQWSDWFQHQGQPMPTQSRRVLFDRAHMSIDLAANGHGLALESRLTAAQKIAGGRLVPAIRDAKPIIQQSLWLVCPYSHLNRRKVRHFYNWLKSTLTDFPAGPAVFKSSLD